jgi:adenylate cyclase
MATPDGTLAARRIQLGNEPPLTLGELRVEPRLRRLRHADGREELVEPRVMQVLVALIRAGGEVVSRDELLESCWNGVVVGEDAIERVIGRIRRLAERFGAFRMETVTKVGYRLLPLDAGPAGAAPGERSAGPAICVLPFLNMSDDPQQSYFSDGMTEDVITDLSKVSALSVLARTTSFSLREIAVTVPELAARLGVSHVLEGSVRKAGGRIRVTAQLVDGASGTHLWAERYDRAASDVVAVQDELTRAIVEALRLQLLPEEQSAIEQRGTHSAEAYELYLLARRYYFGAGIDSGEMRQLEAIERLCRRAVTLDPGYAKAWSLMAVAQTALLCHLSAPGGDGGEAAIERALAIDPDQCEPHAIKARYLLQEGQMEAARDELQIALGLDPDSALAHVVAGRFFYVQRDFATAIPHFEYATNANEIWAAEAGLLLSSYHAVGDFEGVRATALKVLARAEKVLARDYVNLSGLGCGVGALAALGEVDRARALVERALLIEPDNGRMRYNFACGMTAFIGDFDLAIELLQPVLAECSAGLLRHLAQDPDLDPIRDNPRFQAMQAAAAERLGLTA